MIDGENEKLVGLIHEAEPYNRIVLIGNGFDLALGLNTRYSDFILNYFIEISKNCLINGSYQDELMKVNLISSKISNIGDAVLSIESKESLEELFNTTKRYIHYQYLFDFFKDMITKLKVNNWVDIEDYYYKSVKREFKLEVVKDNRLVSYKQVESFNKCMDYLTERIQDFIIKEEERVSVNARMSYLGDIVSLSFDPLSKKELKLLGSDISKEKPEHVVFLNFNYTMTLYQFLKYEQPSKHSLIHIHGVANSTQNPIIFGYGDDTSREYREMELEGEDELLRKIKSFQYPQTDNYHRLLNVIEGGRYEVFIIGHSCGMSDKTMLSTIFEHPNCMAIKNFHYNGEQEDFQKRMAISRHFDDKKRMRKILLNFDQYATIPQDKI